ncbi:S41 family peptidase [Patescibacteria group bacterium]|nr:S41 family peptidase [Patescibacteria group bacterium]MBU2265031.1 S41 family peptidase [Patescibacteria group bacterium]
MKKILYLIIGLILIAASFSGGYWYGQNNRPAIERVIGLQNLEQNKVSAVDFDIFWDTWVRVQEKFVNRAKLDYQKMVYGAIAGMLSSLEDPYTIFMTPEENKDFSQSLQGNLEGIGAEVGMRKGMVTVISPLAESPAMKAGLKAGDKILKVGEKITAGLTIDEAVNLIRGPKGTEVLLTIARDGWSETKEFKIIRAVINIPVVKLEMKPVGEKDIAYLALYHFTDNSYLEFQKAAQEILTSKASGIILDLRNNPGGYLESAVDIASWFLTSDQVVVTEDYGNGKKKEHKSRGINKLGSYPAVILINQGSASASEILAGALRDNKRNKLVGEKSFGKGSVQELEQMPGGTSLKITVAKWLTPSGHSIMDDGLEPDVNVDFTVEDFNNGLDPQLDKALELLK